VIVQTPLNELALKIYKGAGDVEREVDLSLTAYVTRLDWQTESTVSGESAIVWEGFDKNGLQTNTRLNPATGSVRAGEIVDSGATPTVEINSLRIHSESFLIHETLNDNLLIVQQEGLPPEDALWMYEKREDRLTPFNSWFFVEPLLIATHPNGPRLAVFGREFDGSMSLYTVDLASGVAMPSLTQLVSGLIDPPYTAMQWTTDGTTLLLVGESGDFVVSNIGRIEAIYALEIATGAFTRLSPEGTLVDRSSITSR
jgi:hypothetical protein